MKSPFFVFFFVLNNSQIFSCGLENEFVENFYETHIAKTCPNVKQKKEVSLDELISVVSRVHDFIFKAVLQFEGVGNSCERSHLTKQKILQESRRCRSEIDEFIKVFCPKKPASFDLFLEAFADNVLSVCGEARYPNKAVMTLILAQKQLLRSMYYDDFLKCRKKFDARMWEMCKALAQKDADRISQSECDELAVLASKLLIKKGVVSFSDDNFRHAERSKFVMDNFCNLFFAVSAFADKLNLEPCKVFSSKKQINYFLNNFDPDSRISALKTSLCSKPCDATFLLICTLFVAAVTILRFCDAWH